MTDEDKYKMGILFDEKLVKKYPDINDSRADKNENTCKVLYCEFDPYDPDMKAESLICGH